MSSEHADQSLARLLVLVAFTGGRSNLHRRAEILDPPLETNRFQLMASPRSVRIQKKSPGAPPKLNRRYGRPWRRDDGGSRRSPRRMRAMNCDIANQRFKSARSRAGSFPRTAGKQRKTLMPRINLPGRAIDWARSARHFFTAPRRNAAEARTSPPGRTRRRASSSNADTVLDPIPPTMRATSAPSCSRPGARSANARHHCVEAARQFVLVAHAQHHPPASDLCATCPITLSTTRTG